MTKPQNRKKPFEQDSGQKSGANRKWWLISFAAVVVLIVLYILLKPNQENVTSQSVSGESSANETISTEKSDPQRLLGKWLRPDGGYILEIRGAFADGKLDVGYFNPKPINVSKANWAEKDGKFYVLVELRDANYPGSTYGLEYIVSQDRLSGSYYQAVEQSTYDVEFVRENK